MSAVYLKFHIEWKSECTQWALGSTTCIRVRYGFHLHRGRAVCTWAGCRPLCASSSEAEVTGVRSRAWNCGDRVAHRPLPALIPRGQGWAPANSSHPPWAPVPGSLLTLNSRDFHYLPTFWSPFGDSEFQEGGSHDFLPFCLHHYVAGEAAGKWLLSEWMSSEWSSIHQNVQWFRNWPQTHGPHMENPPQSVCTHFRDRAPLGIPTAA